MPDTAWVDLPDGLNAARVAAPAEPGAWAVLLVDATTGRLSAAGPFPDPEHAHRWPGPQTADATPTFVVGIHPT